MKTIECVDREECFVSKAASGDREAAEWLIRTHRGSLYCQAVRMLRNADDANDAVQETFVKALRALRSFDPTRPLRPWLSRICTNCCIDVARNRNRGEDCLDRHEFSLPDPSAAADEKASRNIEGEYVADAIGRLPENYRQIILMRHFQHKDVNEIAADLNAPEGTVKSWLFRARTLLRKELELVA